MTEEKKPENKCCRKACTSGEDAELAVFIKIWAKGFDKEKSAAIELFMKGLYFCTQCADTLKPLDLLTIDSRAQISKAITMSGRVAPDFETAELKLVNLDAVAPLLQPKRKQQPNPPDKFGRNR